MKIFLPFLALISLPGVAVTIPLESFDQTKLESMLRKIPSAYVKTEKKDGFERKTYIYPNGKTASFRISCEADYYASAKVPSKSTCQFGVTEPETNSKDEILTEITDPTLTKELFKAISYGEKVKTLYSLEKVYGLSLDGQSKELFRFQFLCTKDSCRLTTVAKSAE